MCYQEEDKVKEKGGKTENGKRSDNKLKIKDLKKELLVIVNKSVTVNRSLKSVLTARHGLGENCMRTKKK